MDFDLSKENIQPLRGGRNVQQLGIALQAQTNRESQMELLQQKEAFENLIRTYTGDDPLENHYNYISWVEQSYPKHGHEGNVIPLLEHCLSLFERDKRYTNDRRFCKLWIKYFDQQQNPLELYQMLRAKGLCIGCADLYKAWAYYHEAAGDFQSANNVFEEGKRNLAQPYEELEMAHNNLIIAAGQHCIFGRDESRLVEKRHALTSLREYRPGRVGSVRMPGALAPPTVGGAGPAPRPNAVVRVYSDGEGATGGVAAAAGEPPNSIVTAAKSQAVRKENAMKPGAWTTVPVKKRVVASSNAPAFTVHEDNLDTFTEPEGIRLPKNYPQRCLEDYSDWKVSIKYMEPPNPAMIPMYPKHRVYVDPNTEYSIEELRAHRYQQRERDRQLLLEQQQIQQQQMQQQQIQQQQIQQQQIQQQQIQQQQIQQQQIQQQQIQQQQIQQQQFQQQQFLQPQFQQQQQEPIEIFDDVEFMQEDKNEVFQRSVPQNDVFQRSMEVHQLSVQQVPSTGALQLQTSLFAESSPASCSNRHTPQRTPLVREDTRQQAQNSFSLWGKSPAPKNTFDLWESPQVDDKPIGDNFVVFEESMKEVQPKGSAMKTAFKVLNADDLAETGSRGGMDVAETAHAGAKPMPLFGGSDNSSSSFEDVAAAAASLVAGAGASPQGLVLGDVDDPCNTYAFNFNLKAMQVSTPQFTRPELDTHKNEDELENVRKQLFAEPKALSTIFEETKSDGWSSSSSGLTTKSSISNSHTNRMGAISEEHNNYLEENMQANAALRSSLLARLMDVGTSEHERTVPIAPSGRESPLSVTVPMQGSPLCSPTREFSPPVAVAPIDYVPSDPFKANLIAHLLERVNFPGPHTYGYINVNFLPRIFVKKEPVSIGRERYIVEKQLGKGTFGTVFKATDIDNDVQVALKYQKPANKWEFYICRELQARLSAHPLKDRFMDVSKGYFGEQTSILVSEYMPGGSLLDLANRHKEKTGKSMKECLVVYFCIEMLRIIQAMHEVGIVHADIKPDNFLVFVQRDNSVGLQLIDFGCSIDMTLFPPNATFTRKVTTENFVCCEMHDGRPWSYHTDLFCVAATAHVLLFKSYIELDKKDGLWSIKQRFSRYLKVDLWNMFFSNLLNQHTGPADSATLQLILQETLETLNRDTSTALPAQMRTVVNLLKNR